MPEHKYGREEKMCMLGMAIAFVAGIAVGIAAPWAYLFWKLLFK